MIYIKKDTIPPSILVQNKNEWTKELKDNIKRYGGYENIPQDIKNSMWKMCIRDSHNTVCKHWGSAVQRILNAACF